MDIDTDCTIETLFPTGIPDEAAYILCEVMRDALGFVAAVDQLKEQIRVAVAIGEVADLVDTQ